MSEEAAGQPPANPLGCGCVVALVVTVPVFVLLAMAEVLGDCLPDYPCSKNFPRNVLLPTLLLGGGVTLAVGGLIKAWRNFRARR